MKRALALATLTLAAWSSASAALVTETFTAVAWLGPYDGTIGTGSFTYDSAILSGVGFEWLYPSDGLTLTFTLLGQTFHETDDFKFDSGPVVLFFDGMPASLGFNLRATGAGNVVDFIDSGVERVNLGGFLIPEGQDWDGTFPIPQNSHGPYEIDMAINVDPAPETGAPAAGLLLGLGLLALRIQRTRR